MASLQGRRVLLTGASSGIGAALLRHLCAAGAEVFVGDLEPEKVERHGGAVTVAPVDLAEPGATAALIDAAEAALGGVDLYIANAGFTYYGPLHDAAGMPRAEASPAAIERIYRVNLFAPIEGFVELTSRARRAGRGLESLFVCSAMAALPIPGYPLYGSTKAGLHHFAESQRWLLEPGERITVAYPIATRTRFFDRGPRSIPRPYPSQPVEEVALRIFRGLLKGKKRIYPSRLFRVTVLMGRFLPVLGLYQWWERRKLRRWLATETRA